MWATDAPYRKKKRKAEELAVAVVPEATKAEEKPKEKVDPRTPAERAYDEELQARVCPVGWHAGRGRSCVTQVTHARIEF